MNFKCETKADTFPSCRVLSDSMAGKAVFRAFHTADCKGNKTSVRQMVRTEYPDFGKKSAEGCRQALCRKRQRHMAFPLSAVTLHGKTPSGYNVRNGVQDIVKGGFQETACHNTVSVADNTTNELIEE